MIEARIRASIEAYVAAWNERDPAQRMRLAEQVALGDEARHLLLTFVGAALR
jgi:hypothetical protein